jgi:mono/diheme cytochrome c family protein
MFEHRDHGSPANTARKFCHSAAMNVILRTLARGLGLGSLALSLGTACESGPPPFTGPRTLRRAGEAPIEAPADQLNHGQKLFNRYCASCHGYEGGGDGPAARKLDPRPRDFRAAPFLYLATGDGTLPSDADLKGTIRNGVVSRGMPAWKGMQDADLDALVSYIKTFSPRWQLDPPPSPDR